MLVFSVVFQAVMTSALNFHSEPSKINVPIFEHFGKSVIFRLRVFAKTNRKISVKKVGKL